MGVNHRREHVLYESSQFRAGIRAPAVGKADDDPLVQQVLCLRQTPEPAGGDVPASVLNPAADIAGQILREQGADG